MISMQLLRASLPPDDGRLDAWPAAARAPHERAVSMPHAYFAPANMACRHGDGRTYAPKSRAPPILGDFVGDRDALRGADYDFAQVRFRRAP